jgi:outer membrane autotransporter protein
MAGHNESRGEVMAKAVHQSKRASASKVLFLASASLAVMAALSPASAIPFDWLGFTTAGDFTGWTRTDEANVVSKSTTDHRLLGHQQTSDPPAVDYYLTPAAGEYMAIIQPANSTKATSAYLGTADSVFGLTSGTLSSVFSGTASYGRPTNYGALTETVTLNPGTYTFYWAYAAQDYHPFNDGVLFTLSGDSLNRVDVLASNGANDANEGAAQPTTQVVGTYGATQWASHSFSIDTSGSYTLGFVAYNWGDYPNHYTDTAVNPIFYIGASAGTVTSGTSSSPIDTSASYYLASNLGTTVTPDFKGGTLRIDASGVISNAFMVEAYTGNAIDSYGHIGIFSGALSGVGGLTIKDSIGGGAVVFTGANIYSGGTTINQGATLQLGNGGTTGSIIGDVTNNGTLIYNRSDAIAYSSVISGSGRLDVSSGTLTLLSANGYTGGTSIAQGATLQLADGATTGSGDITNNGTLIYNSGFVLPFTKSISGSGSVRVAKGTMILMGANTYTGGTTIASGALLQIGAGGQSGSITGNVLNNGALSFGRVDRVTYDGVISGPGTLSVSGGGTVVLTGANTYSGQTKINLGSTLQLGNGGTTGSIVSDVVNYGVLAFNRSDTVTFNGNVTGDGTLVQNGTGKVIVTTNYTGKTIVNSGTLQIGNGSTSGTVTGNIVNNATVVYGQAASTTYSGVISGSGGLAVAGGGTVVLNGVNTYAGPTVVAAGSLIIGDLMHPGAGVVGTVTVTGAAVVGGYGVIGGSLIATGGVVSPGNSIGTLTVAGDYAPNSASTLKIEVSPTANDKLVVGGKAQLAGTLALVLQPGTYSTSLTSILTAGSISGTFSTVTYSGGDSSMAYGVVYGAHDVDLAMTPKSSGQIYGDIVTQTLDTAEELNDATIDRLNTTTAAGWSAWSKALSGASHTDGNAGLADFNSQLWGVISGADYQFSQGSKVSGVFSYTRNQLGVHGEGDKASVEGYFFALAGHIPVNAFAFDVTGFVQHNIVDTVRMQGGVGNASGSTSNLVGGGSVQASYSVGDLKPFARLTVASIGTDSFKEAGALGFAVGSQTLTSVRGSLGLEASHLFVTENGTRLLPHFMIGAEDEFGETGRDTAITFASTDFTAPAPSPERYSAVFGAGLTATLQDKLELSLETRGRISANQYSGTLSVGAKYKF